MIDIYPDALLNVCKFLVEHVSSYETAETSKRLNGIVDAATRSITDSVAQEAKGVALRNPASIVSLEDFVTKSLINELLPYFYEIPALAAPDGANVEVDEAKHLDYGRRRAALCKQVGNLSKLNLEIEGALQVVAQATIALDLTTSSPKKCSWKRVKALVNNVRNRDATFPTVSKVPHAVVLATGGGTMPFQSTRLRLLKILYNSCDLRVASSGLARYEVWSAVFKFTRAHDSTATAGAANPLGFEAVLLDQCEPLRFKKLLESWSITQEKRDSLTKKVALQLDQNNHVIWAHQLMTDVAPRMKSGEDEKLRMIILSGIRAEKIVFYDYFREFASLQSMGEEQIINKLLKGLLTGNVGTLLGVKENILNMPIKSDQESMLEVCDLAIWKTRLALACSYGFDPEDLTKEIAAVRSAEETWKAAEAEKVVTQGSDYEEEVMRPSAVLTVRLDQFASRKEVPLVLLAKRLQVSEAEVEMFLATAIMLRQLRARIDQKNGTVRIQNVQPLNFSGTDGDKIGYRLLKKRIEDSIALVDSLV